jgi:Cu/Ag efflux protein CusF
MTAMAHAASASGDKPSAPLADHSAMGHGAVDHSKMDHSKMDHGAGPRAVSPMPSPQVAQASTARGTGTVNSVDAAGHKVNLNHNPIPAIGWPAMTMDFSVAHSVDLRSLKPGSRVDFTMQRGGDGMYVIQSITAAGGQ